MIYAFLFLAAFLYFVADRKIKLSILPGIFVTLLACFAVVWRSISLSFVKNGPASVPPELIRLAQSNIHVVITILALPVVAVIAPVLIVAFLFVGKAIGKGIFNPAKDGKGYNTLARILYIAASVLTAIPGLYFTIVPIALSRPNPTINRYFSQISMTLGSYGFSLRNAIGFGVILVFIGVLCTILICTKIPFFRTLKADDPKKIERLKKSGKNPFAVIGFILSGLGNLGVLITALVGLIIWQRVFFFDGYAYTQVLCAIFLLLMILGLVFLGIGLGRIRYQSKAGTRIVFLIVSLVLLVLSLIDIVWLVANALNTYLMIR